MIAGVEQVDEGGAPGRVDEEVRGGRGGEPGRHPLDIARRAGLDDESIEALYRDTFRAVTKEEAV